MDTTRKIVFGILAIFAFSALTGCAKGPAMGSPYLEQKSFWHGGSPNFRPGPPGGAEKVEIASGVDFTKYRMIILDPVRFRFTSTAKYNSIPRGELSELRRDFRAAFENALGKAYPLVEQPNLNALRLRVLIDGIAPSVADPKAGDGQWEFLTKGGASMKAELLDSLSYKRVAAVMDTRTGAQLPAVQSKDKWVHTKEAFVFWAGRLRAWLDDIHGRN